MITVKKSLLKFIVVFTVQYTVLSMTLLTINEIELEKVWKSVAMLCALIALFGVNKFFYTRTKLGKKIIFDALNEG